MPARDHYSTPEQNFQAEPEDFMRNNVVTFDYSKGFLLKYKDTVKEAKVHIPEKNLVGFMKELMNKHRSSLSFYLKNAGERASGGQPIFHLVPALGLLPREELKTIFRNNDGTLLEDADKLADTLISESGRSTPIRAKYVPYNIGDPNLLIDESKDAARWTAKVLDRSKIDTTLIEDNRDINRWDNVGSVEVDSADTNFVFTDAMNGCAYGITAVEGSDTKFKAWHFQSESDNFSQASHFRATKQLTDWFGVNDYYTENGTTNLGATNIIWQKGDGDWNMLSQKNILPIAGSGETTLLASTIHGLNTSGTISEERLEEVHGKLLAGVTKAIKQSDADRINTAFAKLSVGNTIQAFDSYIKAFEKKGKGMSSEQLAIINKITDQFTEAKKSAGVEVPYPADITDFEYFGDLKTTLSTLSTPGRVYGVNYDEVKTENFKADFITEIKKALYVATSNASDLNSARVTTSPTESNDSLYRKLMLVKLFMDIFSDFKKDWNTIVDAEAFLKSFIGKKKAFTKRSGELRSERESLFPIRL